MNGVSLDRFSTSQTTGAFPVVGLIQSSVFCDYNAPYFAYQKEGRFYGVCQGNCNHWNCGRCGQLRAKHEYGRIVVGSTKLAEKHNLYFITITCRGKKLSVREAERSYLHWTNRFLTNCRSKAKREGIEWYYVQVTEKQKRGHPHSHILTSFSPGDLVQGTKDHWTTCNGRRVCEKIPCLRSEWLQKAVISAGLGDQYDVSQVASAAACSRYVAKYLFKDSMFGTHWPENWRRVRYSQSFPTLPERATNAFVLLSRSDWLKLAQLAAVVSTDSEKTKNEALYQLQGHDILVG